MRSILVAVSLALSASAASAQQRAVYGPDGKYRGSVFDYGRSQTYTDRNSHFAGSAIN